MTDTSKENPAEETVPVECGDVPASKASLPETAELEQFDLPEEDSEDDPDEPSAPTANGIIPIQTVDEATLDASYNAYIAMYGETQFRERAMISGSYENILFYQRAWESQEQKRSAQALDMVPKSHLDKFNYKFADTEEGLRTGPNAIAQKRTPVAPDQNVPDEIAILEMISTRKGSTRSYPLYNSGLSITIRAPQRAEIGTLLQRCRLDTLQYGRMFGAHYYLYFDFMIKKAFIDFLLPLIVTTSVKGDYKPDTLLRLIKLPDYNPIMADVAALMYPQGYDDFAHICSRPVDKDHPKGCQHRVVEKADLTVMVRTDFAALSPDAIRHMSSIYNPKTRVTEEAVLGYQNEMLGFSGTTVEFDNWRFTLRVPSLYDYLEAGERFNADLTNEVSADNVRGIYTAFGFNEMAAYLPWVEKVETIDGTTGEGIFSSPGRAAVQAALKMAMDKPEYVEQLRDKIVDFINRVQLTHVCYPAPKCPACGHVPETKTGFVPVEVQNNFFTLAWQK